MLPEPRLDALAEALGFANRSEISTSQVSSSIDLIAAIGITAMISAMRALCARR
jgi:hypothetical protein